MPDSRDAIYRYEPLFGNWKVEEKIGEGSFGVVYRTSKKEMGEEYVAAVKLISIPSKDQLHEVESSIGSDPCVLSDYFEDVVRNLVKEHKLLYALSGNTNIINYQDHMVIQKEDGIGWDILIRMEYITSLRQHQRDHQLSGDDVIRLGIDLCTALGVCSKKGIVHRDIKDDNIFVSSDGVFKLGDFGISKELTKSGRAASIRGTPLYMAPEVYRGEIYDATVDLYSLGILMYKLLNHGRMPFLPAYPGPIRFHDNEDALARRMAGEPFPAPDQAGVELGKVCLKACAFNAGDRYTSAVEMKQDLERLRQVSPWAESTQLHTSSDERAKTQGRDPLEQTVSVFGTSHGTATGARPAAPIHSRSTAKWTGSQPLYDVHLDAFAGSLDQMLNLAVEAVQSCGCIITNISEQIQQIDFKTKLKWNFKSGASFSVGIVHIDSVAPFAFRIRCTGHLVNEMTQSRAVDLFNESEKAVTKVLDTMKTMATQIRSASQENVGE
jgi:serine/threonine protein kinase